MVKIEQKEKKKRNRVGANINLVPEHIDLLKHNVHLH